MLPNTSFMHVIFMLKKIFFKIPFLFILGMAFAQCHTTVYLFEEKNAPVTSSSGQIWRQGAPVIQPGDKVTVTVWGHPELSVGDVTGNFASNDASGRWLLLNDQGQVKLPKIGVVKLAGLNIKEAGLMLEQQFAEELQNPIVIVRVLNHHVTILGEVRKPGVYDLNNEPVSLMQGLGLAAGLTDDAEPERLELIRKGKFGPEKLRLDLTDFATLQRQNIILQPDDILYAPPTRRKAARKNLERAAPLVSMIASLAALYSVLRL